MPQLAKKIKVFLALAPVTTVIFARSPLRNLAFFSDYGLKVGLPYVLPSQNVVFHGDCEVTSGIFQAIYREGSSALCFRNEEKTHISLQNLPVLS